MVATASPLPDGGVGAWYVACGGGVREREPSGLGVDVDRDTPPVGELASDVSPCEFVLHLALDRPCERARPVRRVVTVLGQP